MAHSVNLAHVFRYVVKALEFWNAMAEEVRLFRQKEMPTALMKPEL